MALLQLGRLPHGLARLGLARQLGELLGQRVSVRLLGRRCRRRHLCGYQIKGSAKMAAMHGAAVLKQVNFSNGRSMEDK